MSASKKLASTLANAAGGAATYVDDVFSTYLYTGNGSSQSDTNTITNNIAITDEGAMVWIKSRDDIDDHFIFDTERGVSGTRGYQIHSNNTDASDLGSSTYGLYSFNSNGFTVFGGANQINANGHDYASWTFRKAPGFFDVVTYTGDGTSNRAIPHNLGTDVGTIIVKCTSTAGTDWLVWHKSLGTTDFLRLNLTNASATDSSKFSQAPTSTHFYVGNDGRINVSGRTHVAYLFADGDDAAAQIFGTDGDQAVVKCGSYTGTGATQDVTLGFETQFLLVKKTSSTGDWYLYDAMRGMAVTGDHNRLAANLSSLEYSLTAGPRPIANGFQLDAASNINTSGDTYIYIAIRRPHKPAESGTEVFAPTLGDGAVPSFDSPFVADAAWTFYRPGYDDGTNAYPEFFSRLTGQYGLQTANTRSENDRGSGGRWDYMNGFFDLALSSAWGGWMFKRSPGFFDVVAYTGTGSATTVAHNLGVAPEFIITKKRSSTSNWATNDPSRANPWDGALLLNGTQAFTVSSAVWNDTAPTSTVFSVGTADAVNVFGQKYTAYLFASQDGISKVGSYTGNGSANGDSQNIDCGFTSGARFVMVKCVSDSGPWMVMDTERGIVSGSDPWLALNSSSAEQNDDVIDPYSSGFTVKYFAGEMNFNGREYIYLAIA